MFSTTEQALVVSEHDVVSYWERKEMWTARIWTTMAHCQLLNQTSVGLGGWCRKFIQVLGQLCTYLSSMIILIDSKIKRKEEVYEKVKQNPN